MPLELTRVKRRQILAAFKSGILLALKAIRDKYYVNANHAAIYIGLRMAFPELGGDPRTEAGKNKLDELYAMVDYFNSFNSLVDDAEGMRRVLKSRPNTPHRIILQSAIKGIESHWQTKRANMLSLFKLHRRKKEAMVIANVFERDLRTLVVKGNQDIETYSEEMCIERREYDNAIFVLACAATMYGVKTFQKEYDSEKLSLKERYSWLVDKSVPSGPIRHWVKALHKTYITFGIIDDFQGIEDDLKLGLITYPAYLFKVRGFSKDRIKREIENLVIKYNREAEILGMSRLIRKMLRKLIPLFEWFITKKRKDWSKQPLTLEELREGGVNYLREKMSIQGYLI